MMISLELYNDYKHLEQLKNYQLSDVTYTATPQDILRDVANDSSRHPIVLINESKVIVGFFCLHLGNGPSLYGFEGEQYALIRSLSIDERYRRRAYASQAFTEPFDFIRTEIDAKVNHLILAVNEKNLPAQQTYAKAGFEIIKRGVPGSYGPLLIMAKQSKYK